MEVAPDRARGVDRREIALAVAVEDEHLVVHFGECRTEVDGGGGFADAALVVDDGDAHERVCSHRRQDAWGASSSTSAFFRFRLFGFDLG